MTRIPCVKHRVPKKIVESIYFLLPHTISNVFLVNCDVRTWIAFLMVTDGCCSKTSITPESAPIVADSNGPSTRIGATVVAIETVR